MSVQYVRDRYGVRARRGGRVTVDGRPGTITRCDHGLWVRFDGDKHPTPAHPTWNVIYHD